ncbi:Arf-GAP with coiled-coil, ANK repeat and PH domain-containing protein [Balamuthia mandrillaris]
MNVVFRAVKSGDVDRVREWLEGGNDVNSVDKRGETLLSVAIEEGQEEMLEFLLQQENCDVDKVAPKHKVTPLLQAALAGFEEALVHPLINAKANVNATDAEGVSVLQWAIRFGNEDMVKLLLEKGAKVNHQSQSGASALHFATSEGNGAMTQLLLNHGANIDLVGGEGEGSNPPLFGAILSGNLEIVRVLVENSCDLNRPNKDGETCLHWAAREGMTRLVEFLVEHGAEMEVRSNKQLTPLQVAVLEGQEGVKDVLLKRGAKDEPLPEGMHAPSRDAAAGSSSDSKHRGNNNRQSRSNNNDDNKENNARKRNVGGEKEVNETKKKTKVQQHTAPSSATARKGTTKKKKSSELSNPNGERTKPFVIFILITLALSFLGLIFSAK